MNNTAGNLDAVAATARTGQSTSKAVLFVRSGDFKQTGGLLRMCRTTVMMMGGSATGCVPDARRGPRPHRPPARDGGLGTGQFTQNGGGIDWTAPDTLDATTDPATGDPAGRRGHRLADVNGPEDLALWSESGDATAAPPTAWPEAACSRCGASSWSPTPIRSSSAAGRA